MARTKTTEMSTITAAQLADGDLIPVIDVSDTTMSSTGTNKKLAKSQLAEAAGVTAHAAVTSGVHGISAFGATLVDDADAATARSTLGLGTIATQAAGSVAITGGSVTGITDLAVADGGTGGSTAAAALANLTSTTLAVDGDILTRSGGAPAPITRANLAADEAFASRFVAYDQGGTDGNVRGPGSGVLEALTTGVNNTAMGKQALWKVTTGNGNTAIGDLALRNTTIGVTNVAVGISALTANVIGACNVAIGPTCLTNSLGDDNTAVGSNAMTTNTTGQSNVAVGTYALQNQTTADSNVAVGFGAMRANTTGTGVAVGRDALVANTTGTLNTAIGASALYTNTEGGSNVAVGAEAAYTTNGYSVTAVGVAAARSSTASHMTAIGYGAGYLPNNNSANASGIGAYQTLVGSRTGQQTTGNISHLTCVGYSAIGVLHSTAVGSTTTASGDYSTVVGSGATASHSNSIALGYQTATTAADQLELGARHIEITEIAADAAAPAANGGRLYLKDNGSGKTQLCIRFNSGAVQVIATQP